MAVKLDLTQIEGNVYAAYFADGLWDMLLGIFIIMLTVPFSLYIAFPCYGIGYFVLKKIRQKLTYPRIGYVKINGRRKLAIMPLLGIVLFIPIFLLSHFSYVWGSRGWFASYDVYLSFAVIPVIVAFVAFCFKVKRWYLYAALILLNLVLSGWLWPYPLYSMNYMFLVPGTVIIITGIVTLVRFVDNNPRIVAEELNEQTQNG